MVDGSRGGRPAYRVVRVQICPLVVKRHLVGRGAWLLSVLTGKKLSAVGGPRAGEISYTALGLDEPDDSYAVGTAHSRRKEKAVRVAVVSDRAENGGRSSGEGDSRIETITIRGAAD